MIVTPVIRYKAPHYPDKQTALKDPLLLKNLPRRWAGRAVMVTAVTATAAMMLTGCAAGEESSDAASNASVSAETRPASSMPLSTAASSVAVASSKVVSVASSKAVSVAPVIINDKIAPVFIHGEGRGYFGCVSVAPSVFISEDEALDVIQEMLLVEGIELSVNKPAVQMQIPSIDINNPHGSSSWPYIYGYQTGDLELDGLDVKSKVAFEFISHDDIIGWKATDVGHWSSDSLLDFKATALALNEKLSQTQIEFAVATFYDPTTTNDATKAAYDEYMKDKNSEKYIQTLRIEIENDLRLQVADFIAWLKAEDII